MATVRLHPQSETSEIPLVLLPPFPLDHRAWAGVAQRIGGDVIVVDPPGFGGEADDDPSLEAYAGALIAALDARRQPQFVVAGNSMGGYAAMALAQMAPQRVRGIGLFGTKSTADPDEARTNRLTMADGAAAGEPVPELLARMKPNLLGETTRRENSALTAEVDRWADAAPAAGIAWAQRAMAARPDRTAALQALDVPAVVVHGADDPLMTAESQRPMAAALGVEVHEVAGVGHLLPLEAPDVCAGALNDLWRRSL